MTQQENVSRKSVDLTDVTGNISTLFFGGGGKIVFRKTEVKFFAELTATSCFPLGSEKE